MISGVQPKVDLGYTNIRQNGFTESGGGSSRLRLSSLNNQYFTLSLVLQLEKFAVNKCRSDQLSPLAIQGTCNDNVRAKMVGAPQDVEHFYQR